MSSYHTSFDYMNKNSAQDFNLTIVHFDNYDNGETDSFLSIEPVYRNSYRNQKRIMFGSKYTDVAKLAITVIHTDQTEFSINQIRAINRWLTGAQKYTWLNLYINDEIKYRMHCFIQDVKPYKMDSRVIGLVIYVESSSPWCYSMLKKRTFPMLGYANFNLECDSDDAYNYIPTKVTIQKNTPRTIAYDKDDNSLRTAPLTFWYKTSGQDIAINRATLDTIDGYLLINNTSLDVVFADNGLTIENLSIDGNKVIISNVVLGENITMSENSFISSDNEQRIFGDDFNYIFLKLKSGNNLIHTMGYADLVIEYIEPIKASDCVLQYNGEVVENIPSEIEYIRNKLIDIVDIT